MDEKFCLLLTEITSNVRRDFFVGYRTENLTERTPRIEMWDPIAIERYLTGKQLTSLTQELKAQQTPKMRRKKRRKT